MKKRKRKIQFPETEYVMDERPRKMSDEVANMSDEEVESFLKEHCPVASKMTEEELERDYQKYFGGSWWKDQGKSLQELVAEED